jgi:hypothetical protein
MADTPAVDGEPGVCSESSRRRRSPTPARSRIDKTESFSVYRAMTASALEIRAQ